MLELRKALFILLIIFIIARILIRVDLNGKIYKNVATAITALLRSHRGTP